MGAPSHIMAVAVLDASFVITSVSDEYVAQVMSRKASIGSSFVDIFEEADRQAIRDALARSADGGGGGGMETVRGVRVFSCGSGPNDFPRNVLYNWTLLRHGGDGFLAAAALASDTTAGPSSSEAEELKDFFNKAPIALHWLSSNGKVLWANDRELEVLGYSREEYIGADIMDFCPDSSDAVLEIFKQLGSGNTIRDVPVRFRTKAGKIRDLLIDSNVNYKPDGSFNHTRCFIRDDTGRILREARAEAAATAARRLAEGKKRFSSKLLHNIRTPLHVMTMDLSTPASSVNVPALVSQLRSLSGLCASVAQAMKFDEGYFVTPLPAPTNLSFLVREYREPADGARHEVVVEETGFDETLVVLADGKMIRTVLDELVAHADGRSPAGALIALSVERKKGTDRENGDHFEFRVVDSGEKLDESRVEKVFHNYWLGDEDVLERREEHGGGGGGGGGKSEEESSGGTIRELSSTDEATGLRLNVAFNYVQCLGSTLRVVSDASTTTFKFTLPLQAVTRQEPERTSVEAPARHIWQEISPAPTGAPAATISLTLPRLEPGIFPKHRPGGSIYCPPCRHVLIVEDNTICQKICKRIVTRLGHTADTADNGAIAVDMATRADVNIYDLVLMDLRMPVTDGITAGVKIHEVFPELPIVAFSAEESEEVQAKALDVMVAFMRKPANAHEVKRAIEEHARRPSVVSFFFFFFSHLFPELLEPCHSGHLTRTLAAVKLGFIST